jgi:hypothetical protein
VVSWARSDNQALVSKKKSKVQKEMYYTCSCRQSGM